MMEDMEDVCFTNKRLQLTVLYSEPGGEWRELVTQNKRRCSVCAPLHSEKTNINNYYFIIILKLIYNKYKHNEDRADSESCASRPRENPQSSRPRDPDSSKGGTKSVLEIEIDSNEF